MDGVAWAIKKSSRVYPSRDTPSEPGLIGAAGTGHAELPTPNLQD